MMLYAHFEFLKSPSLLDDLQQILSKSYTVCSVQGCNNMLLLHSSLVP